MLTWTEMSDVERNAWGAVEVMGWRLCDRRAMGWGDGPPVWSTGEDPDDPDSSPTFQDPDFCRNPEHDFMLLQRVRGSWRCDPRAGAFAIRLHQIQCLAASRMSIGVYPAIAYEPGQYLMAAFAASGGVIG